MTRLLVGLFFVIGAAFCSDDVLDLTDSNFKDGVAGKDIMLVEFFAPWYDFDNYLALIMSGD